MANSLDSYFLVYDPVDMAPFEICKKLKKAIKVAHEICDSWNLKKMEIYIMKPINEFQSKTEKEEGPAFLIFEPTFEYFEVFENLTDAMEIAQEMYDNDKLNIEIYKIEKVTEIKG